MAIVQKVDSSPAILLRRTKLTETSLIVTWLSEHHGRVKTVARQARAQKGQFSGLLDLCYWCDIQFQRSRRGDLHTLREVVLREPFPGLRTDYPRLVMAAYFVELVELVTEAEHSVPELFHLLRRALTYLDAHPATRRAMEHFENELARLFGIQHPDRTGALALGTAYHVLPGSRRKVLELVP